MKLIGVTGMSCSGKTTLSDILGEKENVGVIHIDDILREIKLKYFKAFMKQDKNNEKTKVDSRLKVLLYSNKVVFNMFMKFRAKLIEKPLEKQIKKFKDEKKDIIVIDDIFLKYHKCYKNLNKIISVKRPYIDRKRAIAKRDKLSKNEILAYDVAHKKNNYKDDLYKIKTIKINNDGDIKELRKKATKFYILINTKKVNLKERSDIKIKERGKDKDEKCNGQPNRKDKEHQKSNSDGSRS